MDKELAILESEYCPPIDPALFSAILSDFDITDDNAVAIVRETLDAIKNSALEQGSTDFDPSGSALQVSDLIDVYYQGTGDASSNAQGSVSGDTDLTSLSNGITSLDLEDGVDRDKDYIADAEKLDDASKISLLKEMFPGSADFAISYTLRKCNGNWSRAMEELLNHTFFDGLNTFDAGDRIIAKGVDAFSEENTVRRGRKKKQKHLRKTDGDDPLTRSTSLAAATQQSMNHWDKTSKDVDFLRHRINIPMATISSTYHKNSASLPATIMALAGSVTSTNPGMDSESAVEASAIELGTEFPSIDPIYLAGLIHITGSSTAAAHELARILSMRGSGERSGGIEVIPRYAPLNLGDSDGSDETGHMAKTHQRISHSGTSTPVTSNANPNVLATEYLQAQQRSFDQAAAAYRRGRSDHLMAAAAGYYSQQGRDFASKRADATADAADALVESQSSINEIDLHGVSVKDAVRITRSCTERWWRGNGGRVMGLDGRVRDIDGTRQQLRIITGLGRHSVGGRAKIGPAVGRMLFVEGWDVSIGEGVLTIHGRKR